MRALCPFLTHLSTPFARSPDPPTAFFFFFNDTATTEIYTLSLHDALPRLLFGYGREIVRRLASGERRADDVEEDREAGALPESDREKALRSLDDRRVACEPALLIVAAVDGKLLAAHPVHGERAV